MDTRFFILIHITFFAIFPCSAQQGNYKAFTVNDGLPSNNIYRCVEDNKGFLWIGTDAGVARFDGKYFQVFTSLQGLPDNDVLAIVKEKNGRIWVNCFKQKPAYFDEEQNRFINAKENGELAKVPNTGNLNLYPLPTGGVIYYNGLGSYIFRDKILIEHKITNKNDHFIIKENKDGSQIRFKSHIFDSALKVYQSKFYLTNSEYYKDSIVINNNKSNSVLGQGADEGKFYLFDGQNNKCFIYSNFMTNPLRFKLDSVIISEQFYNYDFTGKSIYMVTHSGKIYVINKNTLQQEYVISGDYIPQSYFDDNNNNIWISTIDKGLILYKKNKITHINLPFGFTKNNFFSILRKKNGSILSANYYGEVIEINGKSFTTFPISDNGLTRQRKIIQSGNNIYTFSDEGIIVNYSKQIKYKGDKTDFAVKAAIVYNDSIIIVGYHAGLLKLNTHTQTITKINATSKRITSLTKADNGIIYFGSTDGLYKYNYPENTVLAINKNNPLLSEKITAICATVDNLIWLATPTNGIVVVKDDKVLQTITTKDGINNNSFRSLLATKSGQVWLGTEMGISIIQYSLQHNKVTTSIQNISVNDGLTSNEINEMVYQNDTVYAATSEGISVIPSSIFIPAFNIPVQIINVSINQRDTIISTKYDLAYNQQNIFIRFAGIELSGHFKNLQYTLGENKNWINLRENTLSLQLNNGHHVVQVRAVDVNGNISNKILSIYFNIATPFWKALWFWLIIALTVQVVTIYLLNQQKKKKKEAKLAKDLASLQTASLEQQAFTSLMNPHFMFNALNSIQHYINVQDRQNANRYLSDFASLIRKNFESAQQSFISLEQELENIKIYLRLEQMRFTNRFSYLIKIDEMLDMDNWMIPTMLLQPLLENAVLHGIMPSTIIGELAIELKEKNEILFISITDNGIGIAKSQALKGTSLHKSHGMELILKRMAALSHFGELPITINMSPAFDSEPNPGNKITISIPYGLHKAWLNAQAK